MLKSFLIYIFCPLYILCAGFCCREPVEPLYVDYNAISLDGIFILDDQKTFTLGDTLWINVRIPNTLKDINQNEININGLTSATETAASFELLLKTGYDQLARINISENEIINEIGVLVPEAYDSALRSEAVLGDGFYIAKQGILLNQPGIFTLKNLYSDTVFYGFYTEYNENLVNQITVETSFRSSSNPAEYTFEVIN